MRENGRIYAIAALLLIICAGTFIRLGALVVSDNAYKTDSHARILNAAEWAEEPYFFTPGERDWLPLHFYIMGILLWLTGDPVFMPRLVSLFFGLLSLWAFYRAANIVFGRDVAVYSLLIFAFYPLHIMLSVVSLSETVYLFFLLCFIYYFIAYLKKLKLKHYVLSIACLVPASMTRYEAWVFIFWGLILLFIQRRRINDFPLKIFNFSVITLGFPIAWLLHFEQNLFAEKYRMITRDLPRMSQQFADWIVRFVYWPWVFFMGTGVLFFAFFIIGAVRSLTDKRCHAKYHVLAFGLMILFFIAGTTVKLISADSCYSINFEVLALPVAVYGINRSLTDRFLIRKAGLFAMVFFTVLTFFKEKPSVDFRRENSELLNPFHGLSGIHFFGDLPSYDYSVPLVTSYLIQTADKTDVILLDQQQPETYHVFFSLKKNGYSGAKMLFYDLSEYGRTKEIESRLEEINPLYIVHYRGEDGSEDGFFKDDILTDANDVYRELLREGLFVIYRRKTESI